MLDNIAMEIIIIIILSVVICLLLGLLIIMNFKKGHNNYQNDIHNEVEQLSNKLHNDLIVSVKQQLADFSLSALKTSELNNEKLERFQTSINDQLIKRFELINNQINERLNDINKKVDEKLKEGFVATNESMSQVRERLQAIDSAQKNIEALSNDVISLKSVLEGNQSRGKYGEYQLSMILNQIFGSAPGCYKEQYTLRKTVNGEKVRADAVVFMPEPNKMICIDSKFPFAAYSKLFEINDNENKDQLVKEFANDVKKHITDIKNKYIIDGQTTNNAIMFIPNDGIFAYIQHELERVVDYARESQVIITSPSTLPSILVTINMLRVQYERNKNINEISKQLQKLGKDFALFAKEWNSFSTQLDLASRSREKLDSRVVRINDKFEAINTSDVALLENSEDDNNG